MTSRILSWGGLERLLAIVALGCFPWPDLPPVWVFLTRFLEVAPVFKREALELPKAAVIFGCLVGFADSVLVRAAVFGRFGAAWGPPTPCAGRFLPGSIGSM